MYHGFGVVHLYHDITMLQQKTIVQLYHLKNHGKFHLADTLVKCSMGFELVQYQHGSTVVQLISMVHLLHPNNLGIFHHGNTVVKYTMVLGWYNCTMVLPWSN
jgi:hypothetical protein